MDLGLPELDGFETMRRIRKNEAFQDTPIIVVTAYTGPFHYQAALRAGGNYIMGKPVDFEELEELIQNILQGSITTQHGATTDTTHVVRRVK
jgi:DNA-binding response OmpR family regulator